MKMAILQNWGKEICKFPLEPAYAKALVSGIMMGCAEIMHCKKFKSI